MNSPHPCSSPAASFSPVVDESVDDDQKTSPESGREVRRFATLLSALSAFFVFFMLFVFGLTIAHLYSVYHATSKFFTVPGQIIAIIGETDSGVTPVDVQKQTLLYQQRGGNVTLSMSCGTLLIESCSNEQNTLHVSTYSVNQEPNNRYLNMFRDGIAMERPHSVKFDAGCHTVDLFLEFIDHVGVKTMNFQLDDRATVSFVGTCKHRQHGRRLVKDTRLSGPPEIRTTLHRDTYDETMRPLTNKVCATALAAVVVHVALTLVL